ncbi:MAG: terpene cyclase/mutase family protein, partial [Planctomycetota bacterium]|nr:terpene cyclase/mutase family protein [Planctomycetota bacterium]
GGKATESAVDKALEWLARHQEADGHWDNWKYEGKQEGRTQGINGDAAVTGFALLAFLGAGHTDKVGKYKDNVKRAQDWLCKQLEECEKKTAPGRWCVNHGSNYTQGVAALALAEAAGMSRNPEIKKWAQKAIDGVVYGQIKLGPSEYHAWDYQPPANGGNTNDTSVTGWNIMALKSAKVAGLHVDPAAFEGAMRWINSGQDMRGAPKDGEAEYWEGGMMTYRGHVGQAPQPRNMAMTAAAALTRLFVGGEKPSAPGVAGPCNLMKKAENLPTENKARFNLYYWYYGTLVTFQKGGENWKLWNEAMRAALPNAQRKDGDFDGSWDPYFTEPTGYIYGGRVQSTALGALCLEVYYRYLPIYK